MRKQALARALARKTGVTPAEAADQVDRLVTDLLKKLRAGQTADMPGVGQLQRDSEGRTHFRDDHALIPGAIKIKDAQR